MKIGLEVHVALPTKSKLFCSCSMEESEYPNLNICPTCMGFPGSKPMLNETAVKSALGIANALHCDVNRKISFVRKVYFYPDLPKCYQITQMDDSIGREGYLELENKKIRIRRVQIEEDPAQIVRQGMLTLLDFNRSGTPLVEIVTEPDINTEEELREFIANLRSILYYLGVDINREMKADLNISLAETRVEVKNVTGIKSLIEATRFEVERQSEAIKNNEKIERETRGYNEKSRVTESMREKETDEEYGYIYESDLGTFDISEMEYVEPVYITNVSDELARGSGVNPKTIKEITMLNRDALAMIYKFKEKYSMKSILHGIQRFEKYSNKSMKTEDAVKIERIIRLVDEGKDISREAAEKIIAGEEVNIQYSNVTKMEIEALIEKFVAENPGILEEYKRNKKTINLIIKEISYKNNMHPKDVSDAANAVLNRIS